MKKIKIVSRKAPMTAAERKLKWQRVERLLEELAPKAATRPSFGSIETWTPLREFDKITPAEQEILLLIIEGYSRLNIAAKREVSENTIKTLINRIHRKLSVSNRTEAIRKVLPIKITDRPKYSE